MIKTLKTVWNIAVTVACIGLIVASFASSLHGRYDVATYELVIVIMVHVAHIREAQ